MMKTWVKAKMVEYNGLTLDSDQDQRDVEFFLHATVGLFFFIDERPLQKGSGNADYSQVNPLLYSVHNRFCTLFTRDYDQPHLWVAESS
jgi:hypothetical protein